MTNIKRAWNLYKALRRLYVPHSMIESYCEWSEDANATWCSDCGELMEFNDGTPSQNKFKYCPYCGEILQEKPYGDCE